METKVHSSTFLRKRKLLLVLPLIALPFLTYLFWLFGGGKGSDDSALQQTAKGGLNAELPGAYLADELLLDKLSYYEKAASDSARFKDLIKNDPGYTEDQLGDTAPFQSADSSALPGYKQNTLVGSSKLQTSIYPGHRYEDANEEKVYKKLDELNAALSQASAQSSKFPVTSSNNGAAVDSKQIDRLEQLMNIASGSDNREDPEISQLNGMMDKILDIQHPERIREKTRQISEVRKNQVFAVSPMETALTPSLLFNYRLNKLRADTNSSPQAERTNHFHSLEKSQNNPEQNSIRASIHETQTLVDGSTVKLRLLDNIYINGVLIPKGSFVFGTGSLEGERLQIKINSIRFRNFIFPVQLSVYDMDGINGVYVPGAITRDVTKESAERAMQGVGFTTLDPSLGAQAASAGIEAAKSLLSRKAKLIKFTLKADYQVLLLDAKQKTF